MKARVSSLRRCALVAALFSTQSYAASNGCNTTEVWPTVISTPELNGNFTPGPVYFFRDFSYACKNSSGWCTVPPHTFNVTLVPQVNITYANTFSNVTKNGLPDSLAALDYGALTPNNNYYPFDPASDALDAAALFNLQTNGSGGMIGDQDTDQWVTKSTTLQINSTQQGMAEDGYSYTLEFAANVGVSYVKLSGCSNKSLDGTIAVIERPYYLDSSNSSVGGQWTLLPLGESSGNSIGSYREGGMATIWAIGLLFVAWCI